MVWLPFLIVVVLPVAYFYQEIWTTFIVQGLAATAAGCVFIHRAVWEPRPGRKCIAVGTLLGLLLLWYGISTAYSIDWSVSQVFFLKLVGLLAVMLVSAESLSQAAGRTSLLYAATTAGCLAGLWALAEYAEGAPMPTTWVDPGTQGLIRTRTFGLFTDPNIFGAYLAALLPLLGAGFGLAGTQWGTSAKTPPACRACRWLCSGKVVSMAFVLTVLGLYTTFSRGAFLAGASGLLYFFVLTRHRWSQHPGRFGAVAVLLVLSAIGVFSPFRHRFTGIFKPGGDLTFSQRSYINIGIRRAFPAIPGTGFGPHTFSQVYPRFRPVGGQYPFHAHNEFLQTLMETGVVGLVLLLCLSGLVALHLLLLLWRPPAHLEWLECGALGSFVVFATHNLSGFSDRILATAGFMAVVSGALWRSLCISSTMPIAGQCDETHAIAVPGANTAVTVTVTGMNAPFKTVLVAAALGCFLFFSGRSALVQSAIATGRAALADNQPDKAHTAFKAAVTLDSAQPLAHFGLAQCCQNRSQPASATLHLQSALLLNPTEALFWVAHAQQAAANTQESLVSWRKAIALDPCSEQFRLQLALTLLREQQPQAAVAELEAALSTSPGFHDIFTTYQQIETLLNTLKNDTSK